MAWRRFTPGCLVLRSCLRGRAVTPSLRAPAQGRGSAAGVGRQCPTARLSGG